MGDYRFRWDIPQRFAEGLLSGLGLTLQVTVAGFALAVVLGLIVATLRLSASPLLRIPAGLWIQLLRGVPLFVFLFWVHYGIAAFAGLAFDAYVSAVLALGLTGSAYAAEIYRGALLAIDPGQREGALAMGLTRGQTFRAVLLPQAFRVAVPPGVNLLIALLKGATFVSVIGLADMFYLSRVVGLRFFTSFEMFTVSGVAIIAVVLVLAAFALLLERYLARGAATRA